MTWSVLNVCVLWNKWFPTKKSAALRILFVLHFRSKLVQKRFYRIYSWCTITLQCIPVKQGGEQGDKLLFNFAKRKKLMSACVCVFLEIPSLPAVGPHTVDRKQTRDQSAN